MLPEATVNLVRELLESSTLSQREIARRVGVNRQTVNWIANNKRAKAHERKPREERVTRLAEPIRCSLCNSRIAVLPCQECRARRFVKRNGKRRAYRIDPDAKALKIDLELKEADRSRYEDVRQANIRRGDQPASIRCLQEGAVCLGGVAMPVLQNARYVRWYLANLDELLPLLELPEQLSAAATIGQRWESIKQAGEVIVTVLEAFPLHDDRRVATVAILQAEAEALGVFWEKLLELLPLLVRLVTLFEKGAKQ